MRYYLYYPNVADDYYVAFLANVFWGLVLYVYRLRKKRTVFSAGALGCYCVVLLILTVFGRPVRARSEVSFQLFRSIRLLWQHGLSWRFWELFYNFAMTIPLGFLTADLVMFSDKRKRRPVLCAAVAGCTFSVLIELLQYILCRGTVELDDVLNNTIGSVIGAGILVILIKCCEAKRRKEKIHDI